MPEPFDLAVLGAGPGGYVAAIRAAQLGMKACVVERDRPGGICLNWGCIPTKALIRSAEVYRLLKDAARLGVRAEKVSVDFPAIVKRSRDVAEKHAKGVEYLFKKNKVEQVRGTGRLASRTAIDVSDESGKPVRRVEAKRIVLATGARARSLPTVAPDGVRIVTYKEAMVLPQQPKSMVILGAGAIGCEFAYFYNALGTKTTLVEMLPQILPLEDGEIASIAAKSLKKQGVEIRVGTRVEEAKVDGDGVAVRVSKDGAQETLLAEIALVAIGVRANVEGIGLEEAGVQVEKGFVKAPPPTYETTAPGVYAIGDCQGGPLLAHVASAEGVRCVERIAGHPSTPIDYSSIPGGTYCHPEVASVGLTEAQCKADGRDCRVGRFPYSALGRASAVGETEGLVKVILSKPYGEVLGAHVVGENATELIAPLALAKTAEATAADIRATVHAHPTLYEAILEAVEDAYGEAINL